VIFALAKRLYDARTGFWAAIAFATLPGVSFSAGIISTDVPLLFFWALALLRTDDYRKSGLPMLPVTHGSEFTRLHIVLYTVALVAVTMLPFAIRMSGWIYLVSALALGAVFLVLAVNLQREYSDGLSRRTFRYSIVYLALLFMALLADHYLLW